MSRLVETFFDFVRIDSESGEERAFLEHLAKRFTEVFDAACTFDDYGNLVARIAGRGSSVAVPVLFGFHGDTVKPGVGIDPFLEDGVIRSRGNTVLGADDKAGIAEFLGALRTAKRRPPLEVVVTREEELGVRGARHLDRSLLSASIGFVVDMDALDTVVIGGPSKMSLDVEITGRAAHAAMEPEKGISAIRAASLAIATLREGRIDEETTVNVGILHGGEIRNGVPAKATVQLECRSLSHEKCLEQEATIRRVFTAAAEAIGARATVETELSYRAVRVPENAAVVGLAKRAISSVGLEPRTRVIGGGTDASFYNAHGIETVILGVGMCDEHTTDEHIAVSDMERAVAIQRALLTALADS